MNVKSFLLGSILGALCAQMAESCIDDPGFTWTLEWDNKTVVGCWWLTTNTDKEAARKAKYCDGYVSIRAACAVSCDNCTSAPTKAPTKSPTKAPTKAPTDPPTKAPTSAPSKPPTKAPTDPPTKAPTKAPTTSPTGAPTGPCADSTTYSWKNIYDVTVDCAWLTKNEKNASLRFAKWCPQVDVANACPLTCGRCTKACSDDPSWVFTLDNIFGVERTCSWITQNDLKVAIRRANYCGKTDIMSKCPEACGFCP